MIKKLYASALLVLSVPAAVCIAKPLNITKEEMALTFAYCVDTEAFGGRHQCSHGRTPKSHYWQRVMGDGFCALHHYCWGQIDEIRSNRHGIAPEMRNHLIGVEISEYQYVIRTSPKDFILLPEIYTRMGKAELRIRNIDKANTAFAKARELKPDYWPAYTHWIDFLIKGGKREEARNIAKEGLESGANGRLLLDQYRLLGGALNDIVLKPQLSDVDESPALGEER